MSQWGQGQPGFQYPIQTGFQAGSSQFQQIPQFQQQNAQFQPGLGTGTGGIAPQPTGFPAQRPQGLLPQPTGFPVSSGFIQPQQTSFPGAGVNFQSQSRPPVPPVPPIPAQFQQQNQGPGFLGMPQQPQQQQANRFLSPSPGLGGPGLAAQPTGFAGRGNSGPLVPQVTGYVDPRLQMMSSTFMPANISTPYGSGGMPLLPSQQLQGGLSLQQSIQQYNQEQRGTAAPKLSWALGKAEKKQYDNIFRSWDQQGTGFINGQTALEVFGQSNLPKDDLARIWTLADVDDRGKLNLQEFYVAMGLIYRRLNGMPIPDQLPPELVPPSARDLDSSVNFVKDILKNESRSRSPSSLDAPVSRLKDRSFNSSSSSINSGRDATIYKYNNDEPPGGFYQPRIRHINRNDVRSRADDDSPAADLSDMKRRLENSAKILERTAKADATRTAEDEALERELSDLNYRVRRVQDDIRYVSSGPRTTSKDEERRRLERELMELTHEHLPEVEKRIQVREERREREKREWQRDRDRANERFGRFDDGDDRYSSSRRYEEDRERPFSRGSYDRNAGNRDHDRGSYRRDSPRDRDRDREYERTRSPVPSTPSQPPPPPSSQTAPALPRPSPSPVSIKDMTPEERQEYAKRRIEERKRALGITTTPAPSRTIDTSVEERLAQDRKEAEEKVKLADEQAAERERLRQEKVNNERVLKEAVVTPTPTSTTPATKAAPALQLSVPTPKAAPAPPKRAPAPPPPRRNQATRPAPTPTVSTLTPASSTPASAPAPTPPAPRLRVAAPAPPPEPEVDAEEEALRTREEALRKKREARAERLRQLEKEEEEARLEEERFKARQQALATAKQVTPVAPVAPSTLAEPPVVTAPKTLETSIPPPAPPAPPVPPTPSAPVSAPVDKSSTNPFSRLMKEGAAAPATAAPAIATAVTSATSSSTNPFFRPQTAPLPSVPTPPKTPTPAPIKTSYHTAPGDSEEDWDAVEEFDNDSDSSDDEITKSRDKRTKIAEELFGSGIQRPQSAAATSAPAPVRSSSTPGQPSAQSPASAPPAPPFAPFAPPAPMIPLAPPPAPPAPAPSAPAAGPGDVSALMRSIQGGLKLRPTKTMDRSGPQVSGRVLDDGSPLVHISATARPASPPRPPTPPAEMPITMPMTHASSSASSNRQSVDWYAGLAADHSRATEPLPVTLEEDEGENLKHGETGSIPHIHVVEPSTDSVPDPLADIDRSTEYRVRTLYAFDGDGPDDLSFTENLIVIAHPSKSGGDWWHGTLVQGGKSGLFPKTYVQPVSQTMAKALYPYTASNPDELTFDQEEHLMVVDTSEEEWWKVEKDGAVFVVPAAYIEVEEADSHALPTMIDGPVVTSPVEVRNATVLSLGETPGSPTSDSKEVDTSDYSDTDESESDESELESSADREAREHERQLVLEAAGLIVKKDVQPPPRPPRRAKSGRKRRAPPAAPNRLSIASTSSKELPPVPEPEPDYTTHLDDAFDRYEAFKQTHGNLNRLSVASSTSLEPPSPTRPSTPSVTPSNSRESESRAYAHFLHFLGRKTPVESERTIPVISAPIPQAPESPQRSSSPAFGTSWASLIDKTALEGIPSEERRRQEAIFEFITTEAAYVRDLQLIVEVFYSTMLPLLDSKAVTVIFANVEDILLTNTTFMSVLEERQRECRLYIDRIGDILRSHMSKMGIYMDYCVNQAAAIKVLKSLRDSNPELASHLNRLRDDPIVRNLDLSSYLLVPMQRITKYPLLIRQILQYTSTADERSHIQEALDVAEKILSHINEAIREQEGRATLKRISENLWIGQGRLDLTAPTRYMGARKLLKEGILMKAKSRKKLQAFLCSDILVLLDEHARSLYRMPIPLAEVQVKDVQSGRDGSTFQLALAYPRGGEDISLRAFSVRDCQLWIQSIESASKRCRDAEKRFMRKQSA